MIAPLPNNIAAFDLLDREITEQADANVEPKTCIGCGAKQSPDGSLPCGHDL
ncbi:hypothetical protein [Caballeronia sp. GAWG1-5s-s]|uniref:hypothetical protein n=1 Tax=Caballeronia sp. GAWG1-5s-s TaxID=2921743 RepID=UPI00202869E3|nr:hypothetical protein [Caballeronia sp. GAWG1-5s-s]